MKRMLSTLLGLAVLVVLVPTAFAQGNPRGSSKVKLDGTTVSVEYGRPSLKGRTVDQLLGQLAAGEVWRLGADQSTTFSTSSPLVFGDASISKGEYSLWARKEADNSWKLVFNKQHGQWGTNHDPAQDLVAVPLKEEKLENPAEQVTIKLIKNGSGKISIQWGNLELSASFTAK